MHVIDVVSISTGIFENLVFAGVIYGWPSLQYVLIKEGYFHEQCNSTGTSLSHNVTGLQELKSCPAMMNMFSLVFTLAIAFLNVSALLFGFIMDRYGTWVMRSIATALYSLAFILLSGMTVKTPWLLFPAMTFIAVGGKQMLISNMQLGNLSESGKSIVISLMNGAFDSSALTFVLIKILYDSGVKLQMMMIAMVCLTIISWLRTFMVMPKTIVPFPLPQDYSYGTFQRFQRARPRVSPEERLNSFPTQSNNQEEEGLKACLQNILFWSNLFYFCVGNLQFVSFMGSFVGWIKTIYSRDQDINFYTTLLGFVLLGGLVIAPFNGVLTDTVIKCKKRFSSETAVLYGLLASIVTTSIFSVLLSVSALLPNVQTSVVFALLFRAFLYGGVGNFISWTFPAKHFGKLFGISAAAIGLSSCLQYAFSKINSSFDPTFKVVHSILLCCNVLALIHPLLIGVKLWQQLRYEGMSSEIPPHK